MRMMIFLLGALTCASASAEVFKCVGMTGKVAYQSKPCAAAVKTQQLDITPDTKNASKAQTSLENVRSEYQNRKVARQQQEQQSAGQGAVEESPEEDTSDPEP